MNKVNQYLMEYTQRSLIRIYIYYLVRADNAICKQMYSGKPVLLVCTCLSNMSLSTSVQTVFYSENWNFNDDISRRFSSFIVIIC